MLYDLKVDTNYQEIKPEGQNQRGKVGKFLISSD